MLREAYAAYNRRDIEALTALVSDDVDWPDGDQRLHGKDAVRAYWLHQWENIHTDDEPFEINELSSEQIVVHLHQVVRALDGSVLSEGSFQHTFQIRNGLIERLDIQKL